VVSEDFIIDEKDQRMLQGYREKENQLSEKLFMFSEQIRKTPSRPVFK